MEGRHVWRREPLRVPALDMGNVRAINELSTANIIDRDGAIENVPVSKAMLEHLGGGPT